MQEKWYEITKKPFTVANAETFRFFLKNIYPKIPELKGAYIISLRIHIDFEDNGKIVMYKAISGKRIYYITNDLENPQIIRVVNKKPKEEFYNVRKKHKSR